MDLEETQKKMDEWFESPEADEYFAKINREDERDDIWIEKFRVLFESLNDDELEELMFKFVKWESKHQEMYYQRHILTNSAIFHILFEMIRKYGTSIENDEMFPTESNEFRGFVFNLTHGQGSILWITYKGERIL